MERIDLVEKLFKKGYNCAQSVFGAFSDVLNMEMAVIYVGNYYI